MLSLVMELDPNGISLFFSLGIGNYLGFVKNILAKSSELHIEELCCYSCYSVITGYVLYTYVTRHFPSIMVILTCWTLWSVKLCTCSNQPPYLHFIISVKSKVLLVLLLFIVCCPVFSIICSFAHVPSSEYHMVNEYCLELFWKSYRLSSFFSFGWKVSC